MKLAKPGLFKLQLPKLPDRSLGGWVTTNHFALAGQQNQVAGGGQRMLGELAVFSLTGLPL